MSTVSSIITFRKGRAFTTRKPVPPVVPAPPAPPSATVTISTNAATRPGGVTYEQRVQKSPSTVEIDTRPPRPGHDPVEDQAAAAAAAAAPNPPPPPPVPPGRKTDDDGDPPDDFDRETAHVDLEA